MADYKKPDVKVDGFSDKENALLNDEIGKTVDIIAAKKDGTLPVAYQPPKFTVRGLSDDEVEYINSQIGDELRRKITTSGPEALGPIAAAVIGSVAGSVAGTIVSKKLDSGEGLPDDFGIEVSTPGGFGITESEL